MTVATVERFGTLFGVAAKRLGKRDDIRPQGSFRIHLTGDPLQWVLSRVEAETNYPNRAPDLFP